MNIIIDGFNAISEKNNLKKYDIIIGATGRENVIDEENFFHLKNGVVLINASTRKREFDHAALEKISKKVESIEQFGCRITCYNGNEIYLAADGAPINFFNNESIPNSILDLIFSELFFSLKILTSEKLNAKLYKIEDHWPEIEKKGG